jgi:hypothetical protein
LISKTYCPVVHTTLNWIVIALLIALMALIVIGAIANGEFRRRGGVR